MLLMVGIGFMLVLAGKTLGPQTAKVDTSALESSKTSVAFESSLTAQKVRTVNAADPISTASRNVGGGLVVPLIGSGAALERIAPLPQPTPPTIAAIGKQLEPKVFKRWRLVFNSVVTAAGIFEINGISIILPEIEVTAANEQCTSSNGRRWPCGAVARTAFRNYVKAKAINCNLPDVPPEQAFIAECLLHGRDPAIWLVDQGWARAKTDGSLVMAGEKAKQAKRGLFGSPPAGVESNTVELPAVNSKERP